MDTTPASPIYPIEALFAMIYQEKGTP